MVVVPVEQRTGKAPPEQVPDQGQPANPPNQPVNSRHQPANPPNQPVNPLNPGNLPNLPPNPPPSSPNPPANPQDPMQPQAPPAQVPQLSWSYFFKPEFSGKPDEDTIAHLLRMNDWMETHNFPDETEVQRFCLTLTGEARLW